MLRFLIANAILRNEVPPEGGGGGGTPAPAGNEPPKAPESPTITLTQEQLDRMIASRVAKVQNAGKKTAAELSAERDRINAELEQLRQQQADPSANPEVVKAAREAAKLKADLEALAKERDEFRARAESMTKAERDRKVGDVLRAELTRAGAHAQGLEQAAKLLSMDGTAEVDEDGQVTITIAGIPYTGASIAKAAGAWLAANPHFAKGLDGGSGASRPGARNGAALDFDKASPEALLRAGLSRPPGS